MHNRLGYATTKTIIKKEVFMPSKTKFENIESVFIYMFAVLENIEVKQFEEFVGMSLDELAQKIELYWIRHNNVLSCERRKEKRTKMLND